MEPTYIKVNVNKLKVTTTPEPVKQVLTYDVKTLEFNKAHLIAELAKFTEEKQKEMADIDMLLAKCTELGIVAKIEPVINPTEEPIISKEVIS